MNLQNDTYENEFFEKYKSIIIGIVNTIIINIINAIYCYTSTLFMRWENHKYHDSYETSFVFKLFIFKFINTNISIFYTAFRIGNFK